MLARHRTSIVAGLLAVFLVAGAFSLTRDSATFDETAHLPAGLSYLDRHDFRMNPEHPPLSKAWAALPLWIAGSAGPDYSSPAWNGSSQWAFGYETLNGPLGRPERRDPMRLLVPARIAVLLAGAALGLLLWHWSSSAWGVGAGLLTLFLYCLSPTILAHSRLVTTDLPIAIGFSAALFSSWRFCRSPSPARLIVLSLALALAMLIKFSAFLLLPALAIVGGAWVLGARGNRSELRRRVRWAALAIPVSGAIVYSALWAGYGFRFSAAADPGHSLDWSVVTRHEGPAGAAIDIALEKRLLPEGYLYGLAYFLGGAERRVAFLNGEQSLTGWWSYFPEAFLIKTAPALLILIGWAGFDALRARRRPGFDALVPLVGIGVYTAASIAANLNIGHRHLVPLYPLIFVLVGNVANRVGGSRAAGRLLGVILLSYAASFAVATPRYLSYFNLSVGGPGAGWRYLADSNVDWGQDLIRLRGWMRGNGVQHVHLAYFGTADPAAYGIRFRKVVRVHDFHPERPATRPGPGDVLAVSTNLLQGVYLDRDRELAEAMFEAGWTTPAQIVEYSAFRDESLDASRDYPDFGEWMVRLGRISPAQHAELVEGSLSGWLESLRESTEPDDRVGDSIFIYRLK
ncbi:MAG: hypothetical protein GY716_12265 [bacterium]|nr:hypothetical protein [bacterium]